MATFGFSIIATRYKACEKALESFCDNLKTAKPKYQEQAPILKAQTEIGRLRVWAGNLGAHRTGRSSLDYRLREAAHMRQIVTSLLDDLRSLVRDG